MSLHRQAIRVQRFANRIAWKTTKSVYQHLHLAKQQKLIFILGCQRSGTTLVADSFDKDIASKVYPEFSVLSSDDTEFNIRLNACHKVKAEIKREKASIVIVRPLVESHHAAKLLEQFDGSQVLWIYRHYEDVVSSNLKKFGKENGYKNLQAILDHEKNNWRSENISDDVYQLVKLHHSIGMSPHDAQCLFWYIRNDWFFKNNLKDNNRVLPIQYECLASDAGVCFSKIYSFINQPFPGNKIVRDVHANSVNKKIDMDISPAIRAMCDEMWANLTALPQ